MVAVTPQSPLVHESAYDFYDDFSRYANGQLAGKTPVIGAAAWQVSGAGLAGERISGGSWSSSAGGNTYAIATLSATPWEIGCEFTSVNGTAWLPILACQKDNAVHGFSAMWHALINTTTPSACYFSASYWNDTWNGAGSTLTNQAPAWYAPPVTFAMAANTRYQYRVVFNSPYVDYYLAKSDGTVIATYRTYDPLVSSLIGPSFFIEVGGDTNFVYHSAWARIKPASDSKTYRRVLDGLEGTPIGMTNPAAGNYTVAHVGPGQPKGVFSARYDGTAVHAPGIYSSGTTAELIIRPEGAGGTGRLVLYNGGGGTAKIEITGGYDVIFKGNSDVAFLTKPANSAPPYFAGPVGVTATAVPADADVPTGKCFWWFDSTNGASKVMFKGKSANGTVVTATVALA